MQKRSFVGGAAVLAVAGVLGKVIAAFYRVWLNDLIGPEGLGIYQIPSTYYAFLLVISSAGIPTAISRLVSEHLAKGDEGGARSVFRVARGVLLLTGTLAMLAMWGLSAPLAAAAGNEQARLGFLMLAPSLLIVCMLSAYRGYFQGRQRMTPSAGSQIVEQIGRLVFGFSLAVYFAPRGPQWAAAGAILGVTVSELAALLFILGSYRGYERRVRPAQLSGEVPFGKTARAIFAIAIPVTIGSSIMPLVGLTDTMTVINRLVQIGYTQAEATSSFGIFSGMVQSIINMPSVISLALSISLVPAITEALTKRERSQTAQIACTGTKLAILIGLPCTMGLFLLADPVMALLSPSYTAQEHALAAQLLSLMAFTVMFLSVTQTTTGILQGFGKPMLPVFSLGVGALAKVVLNYVLIGMPQIGICGAAIGSVCCYAAAAALNVWAVVRQSGMRFGFGAMVLKPALCTLAMGASVYLCRRLLAGAMGQLVNLFFCVAVGVAVYGVLILVTRTVTRQELAWVPGGRRLVRLLVKLHVYRGDEA